jgi:ribonuclease R
LILKVLQERAVPMSLEEVAELLGVVDPEDCESLRRRLNAMERDGQLLRNRRDRFCVVNAKDLISGRVIGHPDGYGFVRPDDGSPDLFVSPRDMRALMHDDRVVVSVRGIDRRGRREAALVQVLERNTWRTVGRLFIERGIAYVVPDNKRISQEILIPENALGGAKHGQIVVVEILEQPTVYREAIGRIAQVLGDHMAPGMEIEVAIRNYDLPGEWPEEVAAAVAGLSPAVHEAAKEGRVDLRNLALVTIDGEDARDFDDAVFCRPTAKGWKLYVAIADVAHYVEPDTVLDQEAYRRGNSVYFPERVLPMLPELLSNGLCSLNPQEDRLCMVCEMIVDEEGRIARSRFYEGVMRSHARLTYTEVASMLVDRDPDLRLRHKALVPHLENLHAVYRCLRRARDVRGAIDFETQEARLVFGPGRKIERIVPLVRNDAHRLIEECMIAANIAAARFLAHAKVPHLVRIHEGPTAERLADLRTFLGELGLHLGGGDQPSPKDYAALLEKVRGRPDEHLIQTVMLRSLAQAIYGPEKKGHFGLASDAYTHFTSPIRRYPDLLVHRAVKHALRKAKPTEFRYTHNDLVLFGEHCSTTERRADEATRDVLSWLKCEFMMDKLGEEFDAIISAVTPFGFFAELSQIYIEGLVHISNLDKDFFHYDPIGHRLVGERSGVRYRLGDRVRVKVARVDLDERKIDLELVRKTASAPAAGRRGGRRRSRTRRTPEAK